MGHWYPAASLNLYPNDAVKSSRTAGPREPKKICQFSVQSNPRTKAEHTVGVFHGDDLLVIIEVVKERSKDSPASI